MQVVDLFGIFSWEMSFPEGSSFFEGGNDLFAIQMSFSEGSFFFESGNALSNIVSNIRKASSACFPNCPFISFPYWTLSAFFKSEVNDFFTWPLWYSPIHSAQTDLSQGMQWYSSFYIICPEHTQYKISSLVRLFDVRGTTTWPRVSFFLSWSFLHVSQRWPEHVLQRNLEGFSSQSSHSK